MVVVASTPWTAMTATGVLARVGAVPWALLGQGSGQRAHAQASDQDDQADREPAQHVQSGCRKRYPDAKARYGQREVAENEATWSSAPPRAAGCQPAG